MTRFFCKAEKKDVLELDPFYLSDLGFIYSGFKLKCGEPVSEATERDGFVPPVRVALGIF